MPKYITIPVEPKDPCEVVEMKYGDVEKYIGAVWDSSTLWMPMDHYTVGASILVDDMGLHKKLPFNPRASALRGLFYRGPATLVGPAVVMGFNIGGDTVDVPSHLIEIVSSMDCLYKELMGVRNT
jgi:hypothetical protein